MNDGERIKNALLLDGLDDILSFGWIIQTIQKLTGLPCDSLVPIDPSLEAIHDLLKADYAFVGNAVQNEKGYTIVKPWNLPPSAAVARINQEFSEVTGDDRDYFVWMELTDKGRGEAQRLDEEGCDPWKDIRKGD